MASLRNVHAAALYNKPEHRHTLQGNWQEEAALEARTGVHRYNTWVATDDLEESVFATKQDRPRGMDTFERTLAHDNHLEPAQWQTQSQGTYRTDFNADPAHYTPLLPQGRRAQLELEAMTAEAAMESTPPEEPTCWDSTSHDGTCWRGPSETSVGRRVMRTQDGATDVQRDPVFLAEHKLLDKTVADKMAPGSGGGHFTAVFADSSVPINLYSERAARGNYGGTLWGTATVRVSPFGRSQNFSKPISDYSKVMDPEWAPMAAGE